MHSFQAGCEWFSRSQDGDIPPLPIGRGQHLGGIGRIVRNHCLFEHALKVVMIIFYHKFKEYVNSMSVKIYPFSILL
ncbi:hypothetical protein SAMN05421736_10923 [Evansella caseinilytica]|uniref:Uncharacterized protein n=1 Tax=Evansella caseinilytica TaxID=1503961 RepID=A0A1H3RS60_9BACI|nr:hypothetical protein [Evansella caseinilytica]SDZ28542.1 hypothetical protein SAMN05421736_10923 [Evansella caseinilytica]